MVVGLRIGQDRPQFAQFGLEGSGRAGQAQAGKGRQPVGLTGRQRAQQRTVGRQGGGVERGAQLRPLLAAGLGGLPGAAGAGPELEHQVRTLEADPAPQILRFRVGRTVEEVVGWRVAVAGVAAGAVVRRDVHGEAVGIGAGHGAQVRYAPTGRDGRDTISRRPAPDRRPGACPTARRAGAGAVLPPAHGRRRATAQGSGVRRGVTPQASSCQKPGASVSRALSCWLRFIEHQWLVASCQWSVVGGRWSVVVRFAVGCGYFLRARIAWSEKVSDS